jgi:hypothetical protein
MRELETRHPDNVAVKKMGKCLIKEGNQGISSGEMFSESRIRALDYRAHTWILQDLLQIISTHPDFWYLTSKEYTRE